jgi:prepilin-type N-terminal cleavage/methylation domain-containing protein
MNEFNLSLRGNFNFKRKKMKNKIQTQSGYTLVELTIGITVAGLVLSATLMGVQRMMDSMAMNKTVTQISNSISKIKSITIRDKDNSFITTSNMLLPEYNVFEEFTVNSTGIRPANGSLRIFLGNSAEPFYWRAPPGKFDYWIENPSVSECVELAGRLEGLAETVYVRQNSLTHPDIKTKGAPYTSDKARAACTNINALVLRFPLQ